MISLLALFSGVFIVFAPPSWCRAVKRIAYGTPVKSEVDFSTQHFVVLLESWACVTNQEDHNVHGCRENPICGGSIFHPEFVLTAAHCVTYTEFYLRNPTRIYAEEYLEELSYDELGYLGLVNTSVHVVGNQPRVKHAFYSEISLAAGSTDFTTRTQKRHANRIFRHPTFSDKHGKYASFSLADHDVALIQACQPFEITSSVKPVSMMPQDKLTTHFESIVKRSAICLFLGFGKTEDTKDQHVITGTYRTIYSRYLRYTWRHTACPSECNENLTAPVDTPRNPCVLCSDHIPPKMGTPDDADSGGPVICDGFYTATIMAAFYSLVYNFSLANSYPVHCIRHAITPERLAHYKSISQEDGKLYTLGPVSLRRLDVPFEDTGLFPSQIK